ncbi:hypothetical protein [Sulfitobacter sp. JB4-11]|uniref:hypothetical protein n=1 Tax=Sulfitobacter rhodophyticola TaxID=3238304 RepID=UPI003512D041
MRRSLLLWPLLLMMLAAPVLADARMTVLVDVLKLREAAEILRIEGVETADELDLEMLDGQGGASWQIQVDAIYDTDRMVETVRAALERELQGDLLEEVIRFYSENPGARIVTLENTARDAIRDPAVEEAARARFAELDGSDDPRLGLIAELVASGDMVDRNVTNAMNANVQFLRGLVDGDAAEMTEEDMLSSVSGDLDEMTDDTRSWLFGYMLLAYSPLETSEIEDYLAFSRTPAGEALNRALFDGFGRSYEDISYALGRAVALNMLAEEL